MDILPQESAIVLLAGSSSEEVLSSATLDYQKVIGLHVVFGNTPVPKMVKDMCEDMGVELVVKHVPEELIEGNFGLHQASKDPDDREFVLERQKGGGFNPGRNLILYAIALNVACNLDCMNILAGLTDNDAGGFPDRGGLFIDRLKQVLNLSVASPSGETMIKLKFPLRAQG